MNAPVPMIRTNYCTWIIWDDDCDYDGYYFYTMDINNFVTDKLISVFGNPKK